MAQLLEILCNCKIDMEARSENMIYLYDKLAAFKDSNTSYLPFNWNCEFLIGRRCQKIIRLFFEAFSGACEKYNIPRNYQTRGHKIYK